MNVCTDQLAMLIAADGQLLSVSYLANDPGSSVLAAEAGRHAVNHGLAEEVFLMKPDLVLAGTFSTRATVTLLRRLGVAVEEFAPEASFDDVRANIRRIGVLLGREARAAELVADLDRRLASVAQAGRREDVRVASWFANSYTAGAGTLVDAVITAAGFTNMASRFGYEGTARLPLELLILVRPEMLLDGGSNPDMRALAHANFGHPAYRELAEVTPAVTVPSAYTICGAPFTAEAVRLLRDAVQEDAPR